MGNELSASLLSKIQSKLVSTAFLIQSILPIRLASAGLGLAYVCEQH